VIIDAEGTESSSSIDADECPEGWESP